jgi:hypothetical protein
MKRALAPLAVTIAAALSVALAVSVAWCTHASAAEALDVRAMMLRVEQALIANRYPQAYGYSELVPPKVEILPKLPAGDWGSYQPGLIKISDAQPHSCKPITLAHEVAHDAAVRMNLIWSVPTRMVRAELEHIADIVEREIESQGPMAPNCIIRRFAER